MNFHLQPPYEYQHLKLWFRENWKELPKTLDTPHADHRDVKKAIKNNIASIDKLLSVHGKMNKVAESYQRILETIYEGLKVSENWDLPMKKNENKQGFY
jgi:hypothetical protein